MFECVSINGAYARPEREFSWAQGFMSARNFVTGGTQKDLTGMALGMQILNLQEYCAEHKGQVFLRAVANLYDMLPDLSHAGKDVYVAGAGTLICRPVAHGYDDETIEIRWAQGLVTGENAAKTVRKNLAATPSNIQMAWLLGYCGRRTESTGHRCRPRSLQHSA